MDSNIAAVFEYYQKEGVHPDEYGFLDIDTIFDGTWHTRGHNSSIGAAVIIDARSGLVIDYEILSKKCIECTKKENALKNKKITPNKYENWRKKT